MIDLRRECSSIYKLKRGMDGEELGYLEEQEWEALDERARKKQGHGSW